MWVLGYPHALKFLPPELTRDEEAKARLGKLALAIFMLLQWPISRLLRGNALRESVSGIPYRGEGMALIAIVVSFVTVAPMVAGLSKHPNGAEMAVFRTVGTMALS